MIGPVKNGREYELSIILSANLDKLQKGLGEANRKIDGLNNNFRRESTRTAGKVDNVFSKSMASVGGAIAAAFSVQAVLNFGKEAVMLAAKAEGVEAAFERLNQPALLSNLRKATRGTITDVELMRQAVRAENFKVPLDQLATFFEFATKRAAQTGESVDYLVNSIIDGIGRKSTLVMDNLGISAAQLQEEIKKTGDFGKAAGNIIESELAKAGDVAETTAQKIDGLKTAWTNLQTEVGKKLITSDLTTGLTEFLDYISTSLSIGEFFKPQDLDIYQSTLSATLIGIKKANEDAMKSGEDLDSVISRMTFKMVDAKAELKRYGQTAHQNSSILADLKARVAAYTQVLEDLKKPQQEETKEVVDNTDAILKQADAIIKRNAVLRESQKIQSELLKMRNQRQKIEMDLNLGVDPQGQFAETVKQMEIIEEGLLDGQIEMQGLTNAANIFGNAFGNAFTDVISGTESMRDAFKNAMTDIMRQISMAIARLLVFKALSFLFGGVGGAAAGAIIPSINTGKGGGLNPANPVSGGLGHGFGFGKMAGAQIDTRIQGDTFYQAGQISAQKSNRWRYGGN